MNTRTKIKIGIDTVMLIGIFLCMPYSLISETVHEYIGIAVCILFIVHNVLNRKYYSGIFKGKYGALRLWQLIINIMTFISMAALIWSGIVFLGYVPSSLYSAEMINDARIMHLLGAYWGFICISMHLGNHWYIFKNLLKKYFSSKVCKYLNVIAYIIACYGIAAFIKHDLISLMLLQNEFVFFDPNQSLSLFIFDYIAMMCLYTCISYKIHLSIMNIQSCVKQKVLICGIRLKK